MEELDGIAGDHLILLVLRNTDKAFLQDSFRVRPIRLEMRKVVRPHDLIHSHLSTCNADARRVAVETPIGMFPCVLAGKLRKLRQTIDALDPVALAAVLVIQLIQPIGNPPDLDLCNINP